MKVSSMKFWLKMKIRNNYRLFGILSMITGKGALFHRYVNAYCSGSRPVILIEGNGSDSDIYYRIDFGVKEDCSMGFFALVANSARYLYFTETCGLKPIVFWGEKVIYFEPNITETNNVLEYYYQPIGNSELEIKDENHKYIERKFVDSFILEENTPGYILTEQAYRRFAEIYRKYFHLNEKTRKYITDSIDMLIRNRRHVLGVHLRGTNFKRQFDRHPTFTGFQQHVELCRKLMEKYQLDLIFVATDDIEALELMQREFGDRVLYYKDCCRSRGDVAPTEASDENRYTLGIEVLRDAYTLSSCEALVCGLSQVACAARYIKMAGGGDFIEIAEVSQTINHNGNYYM